MAPPKGTRAPSRTLTPTLAERLRQYQIEYDVGVDGKSTTIDVPLLQFTIMGNQQTRGVNPHDAKTEKVALLKSYGGWNVAFNLQARRLTPKERAGFRRLVLEENDLDVETIDADLPEFVLDRVKDPLAVVDGSHRIIALRALAEDPEEKAFHVHMPVPCVIYRENTPRELIQVSPHPYLTSLSFQARTTTTNWYPIHCEQPLLHYTQAQSAMTNEGQRGSRTNSFIDRLHFLYLKHEALQSVYKRYVHVFILSLVSTLHVCPYL